MKFGDWNTHKKKNSLLTEESREKKKTNLRGGSITGSEGRNSRFHNGRIKYRRKSENALTS